MINSQNGVTSAPVLRSGESIASTVAAIKDKNAKTFYHMIPGARFVMPDGLEIKFLGGQFVTNDPELIAELNKVVDKSTSMIFSKRESAAGVIAADQKLAADAADTAGKDTK
jgi:hypothetical protein